MRGATLLALAVLLVGAPATASAGSILSPEDAAELANSLADAREEQGVCYGWIANVDDDSGGAGGLDYGSDRGPDTEIDPKCTSFMALEVGIRYTSDSSESEDSALIRLTDSLPGSIGVADLKALGYDEDDLLGDQDDVALMNMVGALPALAAEKGGAKPVPFEAPGVPPAQQGEPTGSPGSDFVRENVVLLILGGVLLAFGVVWLVLERTGKLRPTLRAAGVKVEDTGGADGPR